MGSVRRQSAAVWPTGFAVDEAQFGTTCGQSGIGLAHDGFDRRVNMRSAQTGGEAAEALEVRAAERKLARVGKTARGGSTEAATGLRRVRDGSAREGCRKAQARERPDHAQQTTALRALLTHGEGAARPCTSAQNDVLIRPIAGLSAFNSTARPN